MLKVGVLVSGGGTNLQAIIDAIESQTLTGVEIITVVSSKEGVFALERAKNHGLAHTVIPRKAYESRDVYDVALLSHLSACGVDLVVLAGFMCVLGNEFIETYANRIINVHPSLIPSFCGDGYYGLKVHEAVLEYGVKLTGATVHYVNEVTDGGAIILQRAVEVETDDTPETLQKRVMTEVEWKILPEAIGLIAQNKVKIDGRKTIIK